MGLMALRWSARNVAYSALVAFVAVLLFYSCYAAYFHYRNGQDVPEMTLKQSLRDRDLVRTRVVSARTNATTTFPECSFHRCFDVYHCGYNDNTKITVYVYPLTNFVDENGIPATLPVSKEFLEILNTIADSVYYTEDPTTACLFVPSIDLINFNSIQPNTVAKALAKHKFWNKGRNHLLFNMLSSAFEPSILNIPRGMAVVAGAGFPSAQYRRGYDVSIPLYNSLVRKFKLNHGWALAIRPWLMASSQFNIHDRAKEELWRISERSNGQMIVMDLCTSGNYTRRCRALDQHDYPDVLTKSTFCLVMRGSRLGQTALFDAMMAGCIPVIAIDGLVMPFSEVLDWKRAAVFIYEQNLHNILEIVREIPEAKIVTMRKQIHFYWTQYFSTVSRITLTTLRIMNDRVFPYAARKYEDWNEEKPVVGAQNPLFLPIIAPARQGFTAVVLTYNRLDSLFKVIKRVSKVPSLQKVLVIWNNVDVKPPTASNWPSIGKPLKVVRTEKNLLSNRFYPYDEIETEAILALDDDIVMLTSDEIEFGYHVWREFKDRLVGFPSRWHHWDNATGKFRYESEWTSEVSMVLTGAAFYHKYYSYLYTNSMPGHIKEWVDEHINCEDLAMNFLIANFTGKSPIKVAPRKKFKCPECTNIISADQAHMFERTECINKFADTYGTMPLKTVEFRADPVLYKDSYPDNLKKFNDIGYV